MNIGIDISQINYPGTGVATYTVNLVSSLIKLYPEVLFSLFATSLRKKYEIKKYLNSLKNPLNLNTSLYSLPLIFFEFLWNQIHLIPIEKFVKNISLFHSSDWLEPPSKAPKITTIHDLIALIYPGNMPSRIINNHRRKLSWVQKEEKLIIADSMATKSDIIDLLKIPEGKIRVIPLAPGKHFERENLILKAEVVKGKYGINKPFFLSVGTRAPRKNLQRSITAYDNFPHKENVDYLIAGNFGWGEDIKPVVGVKVLGYVPEEELAVLYQEALGFIFPSLYEGFGLPILEAESMGCPVIASERGSIKEVLAPLSLRINPESEQTITEAMEYLYSIYESQKYFEIVKDGQEFAKKFSWEKTASETLSAYKELIG